MNPAADDERAANEAQLRDAADQSAAHTLWPVALGLGCVYALTMVSHALRLDPPHRDPLGLAALGTAALLLFSAALLKRRPPARRWGHRLSALLAVIVLANETLQQHLLMAPPLQVYSSLYFLGIGLFILSPRWLLACLLLGAFSFASVVWREGLGGMAVEWGYAHGAAALLGLAAHIIRLRSLRRTQRLRIAQARQNVRLQQALAELRESEALFRHFADHSGQVFWINDGSTHRAAYVNSVYETLLGRPSANLDDDPMDWLKAVHEADRPRVSQAYHNCLAAGSFDERYRIVRPDGQVRWVHEHGFVIREASGRVRVGGIMRDVTDAVLAEEQLRHSERTNRAILHAIPDMILRIHRSGRYVTLQAPRAFNPLWGVREEKVGWDSRDVLPPALYEVSQRQVALALDTGQVQTHEYAWRQDGGEFWREWRMAPVGPDEVLVIVRDITARKAAEQALSASRQRLSDLISDVEGIVWERDAAADRYSFISPRAQAILGYPLEAWRTQPDFFMSIVHPEDRRRVESYCRQRRELGQDHELDYRVIAADGRLIWMHDKTRVICDEAGRPQHLRGILVDVSESMRWAQTLRESQLVLDKAQEIAQLGSWTWDRQHGRVTCSPQMYAIHGLTPEAFDGSWMSLFQLIHPDDQARVWLCCEQAVATGKAERCEYQVRRPDGTVRIVRADGELHRDEQGRLARVIGTVQDITELRLAEAERARLEDELRQVQKLEAVGTLASGVAHDFNNLLTAINGYADLARHTLPADHPALKSLDMIEVASDQAAGVTRGLLTFAHHTPFEKAPTDLAPNLGQSIELLRRLLPASIQLIDDLADEGDIWVNADTNQLQQVWLNLAVNARDAMPTGGKLSLRLRKMHDAPVNPQDSWHGQAVDTAVITVTDTGSGMSEATLSRVFEPYFTTKPRGQGTGLGLSIVHGIISDHGGRIRVQSEPGKGTRFTIYLPCCPPPEPAKSPVPAGAALGRGEMILLAEDNEFVRAVMVSSLKSAGYRVVAAPDGDAALAAFHEHRANLRLVVLDLDLPGQCGHACLRAIREAGDDVPALLITGNVMQALQGPSVKETVLMKPFQIARLIELVTETLGTAVTQTLP